MRFGVCLFLSCVVVGCSARGPFHVTPETRERGQQELGPAHAEKSSETLESFIEKVRRATAEARPPEHKPLTRVESTSPPLAAALAAAEARPSAEAYRVVAYEYRRLGIADEAHEYLDRAAALAPRDSLTYQDRAQMWRDGGLIERALSDAHRAVYYAPRSAAAHNTLGTVFQALGRRGEARQQYEDAIALDPTAAYALNNLCYSWVLDRQPAKAIKACNAAIELAPSLRAARNNLGLAYAASGNIEAARQAFAGAGDRSAAAYNLGIVQLARRQYTDAVSAFVAAQQLRPNWRLAEVRAHQAEKLAKAGAEE